jgi:hypothetical protein
MSSKMGEGCGRAILRIVDGVDEERNVRCGRRCGVAFWEGDERVLCRGEWEVHNVGTASLSHLAINDGC